MEQRDFLKDQIEQMGKVLAKILSDFLGMKSEGLILKGIETTNQRLQSELDIEFEKLMTLPKKELKDYLKNRKLTGEHVEMLSDYLREISKKDIDTNKEEAKKMVQKAIDLLDLADEISKTLSLDRINKKNEWNDLVAR